MRVHIPKRIRLGFEQKQHGQPRRWTPSWVREQWRGRPILEGLSLMTHWLYMGRCGPDGHDLPCACAPRPFITDMVSRNNALLSRLRSR